MKKEKMAQLFLIILFLVFASPLIFFFLFFAAIVYVAWNLIMAIMLYPIFREIKKEKERIEKIIEEIEEQEKKGGGSDGCTTDAFRCHVCF
jgi:predicted membrane protein